MWPASGLTRQGYYETRLGALSGPQSFSLTLWTVGAVGGKVKESVSAIGGGRASADEKKRTLTEFFASADEANDLEGQIRDLTSRGVVSDNPALAELEQRLSDLRRRRAQQSVLVESLLEEQVQSILKQQDLALLEVGRFFLPPVFFKLIDLPHVLIVAHRDRFEMRTQVAIRRAITSEDTEALEAAVDRDLGVSSLLVPIGGYSTYPTMIAGTAPFDFVVGAVTHEWCHIYMMFKPLGAAYGRDGDVTAMNETVCSIFGDDAAALVRETFYGAEKRPRPWQATPTPTPAATQPPPKRDEPQGFNANRELRRIYLAAEERLKANDIAGAEQIMEDGRAYLAENGVYIRKLNQAFFAFYGSYAEGPEAIRPDFIGDDLRELRRRSASLRDFFETVAQMSSYGDLKQVLGK
jgi:hypothetical protein